MRIKILMLSSLVLLAFFAINSSSIKWDDPGSQSVDQMFTGDNRSTIPRPIWRLQQVERYGR
jgi:hypothetical protein